MSAADLMDLTETRVKVIRSNDPAVVHQLVEQTLEGLIFKVPFGFWNRRVRILTTALNNSQLRIGREQRKKHERKLVEFMEWVKKERGFGYFQCDNCGGRWKSGFSYEEIQQSCLQCGNMVRPYRMQDLETFGDHEKREKGEKVEKKTSHMITMPQVHFEMPVLEHSRGGQKKVVQPKEGPQVVLPQKRPAPQGGKAPGKTPSEPTAKVAAQGTLAPTTGNAAAPKPASTDPAAKAGQEAATSTSRYTSGGGGFFARKRAAAEAATATGGSDTAAPSPAAKDEPPKKQLKLDESEQQKEKQQATAEKTEAGYTPGSGGFFAKRRTAAADSTAKPASAAAVPAASAAAAAPATAAATKPAPSTAAVPGQSPKTAASTAAKKIQPSESKKIGDRRTTFCTFWPTTGIAS